MSTVTIPIDSFWRWVGGVVGGLLTAAIIATFGYAAGLDGRIDDHENRLNLIEQTRFTAGDGVELLSNIQQMQIQLIEIQKDISQLREELHR